MDSLALSSDFAFLAARQVRGSVDLYFMDSCRQVWQVGFQRATGFDSAVGPLFSIAESESQRCFISDQSILTCDDEAPQSSLYSFGDGKQRIVFRGEQVVFPIISEALFGVLIEQDGYQRLSILSTDNPSGKRESVCQSDPLQLDQPSDGVGVRSRLRPEYLRLLLCCYGSCELLTVSRPDNEADTVSLVDHRQLSGPFVYDPISVCPNNFGLMQCVVHGYGAGLTAIDLDTGETPFVPGARRTDR